MADSFRLAGSFRKAADDCLQSSLSDAASKQWPEQSSQNIRCAKEVRTAEIDRDVPCPRAVKRSGNVAPRDRNAWFVAGAEIYPARGLVREGYDYSRPPAQDRLGNLANGRAQGASRCTFQPAQRDGHRRRSLQFARHVRREAVRWNHVKAGSRHCGNSGPPDLDLSRPHRLEDFDFTRDIDVVRPRGQACTQHWSGSRREWTRHMHNAADIFQGIRESPGVVETDRARRQIHTIAHSCQRVFIATGENDIEFSRRRKVRRQAASVAIRAIQ